ncbi:RND family transporter [Mycobacterium sp.]|uniref:MMPL/RND family transporter n=1 Tax=Mycobacterium sp. TaxID=1785 RepID=UPI003A87B11D
MLALTFPPLAVQAAKHEDKPLPDEAPTTIAQLEMNRAFSAPAAPSEYENADLGDLPELPGMPGMPETPEAPEAPEAPDTAAQPEKQSGSLLLVVLTDENGLSPEDEATYRKLLDNLKEDTQDKVTFQDFMGTPELREMLESKDKKAWNLPINLPGALAAPETVTALENIREIVHKTVAGTTLTANLSGPVATLADVQALGEADIEVIELGTIISVLVILILVYRNVVTMLVPLATIGVSIVGAQGVLSVLAEMGLAVNMQCIVFMSAVMIGAGVDYAVFLISRYHDYVRHGATSDEAVKKAMMSIGKVIAASAATVAVTFLAMVFTKLEVFSAVGPAITVSIIVTFLAASSFLPAILVLTGRRGWIKPRRDLTTRFWRISGTRIVRRPKIHLVGSLIALAMLAGSCMFMRFNYDDLKVMPQDVESVKGLNALNDHFPRNSMTPMMLFVESPRDLRSPAALGDLEMMSRRIANLPDIVMVRGLTRPNGEPLKETKVSFQAGEVGSKLNEASTAISEHGGELEQLVGGSRQLADALGEIRSQVNSAVVSSAGLVSSLQGMIELMGGDKTIQQLDDASHYVGQMRALGNNLSGTVQDAEQIAVWAGPMVTALNASPECNASASCVRSRSQLSAIVQSGNNGLLRSIGAFAITLQRTQEYQNLAETVGQLDDQLKQIVAGLKMVKGLPNTLSQLKKGAGALADGSGAVADGVAALVDQIKQMGGGLNEASDFLLGLKHDADRPSMAGFNIPPQIMTRDEFKAGAQFFLSPDGHAARYFIQSALGASTPEGMDQVNKIVAAARSAQPNSELADAKVEVLGIPSAMRDTRDFFNADIRYIVVATILIVFFILVILLRALIAPLYLIASVLGSFMSALGLSVIVFQFLLGIDMHWSLPGLSFILLVAVGADYNMLLISRIRDESPHGVRVGVIRTVGSTGGVITSAGLIFAASMFGLLAASITTMAQAGFTIGIGIVLDTFLVRTITVPALAAMIGQANWWPSAAGLSPKGRATRRQRMEIVRHWRDRAHHFVVDKAPWLRLPQPASTSAVRRTRAKRAVSSIDLLPGHALPLFGLTTMPNYDLEKCASQSRRATGSRRSGAQPVDHLLTDSLPLFGLGYELLEHDAGASPLSASPDQQ